MSDLIDRKKAIEAIKQFKYTDRFFKSYAVDILNVQPTVDAIPISWLEERIKDWLAVTLDEYGYEIAQRQADKYLSVVERWRREQEE